MAVGLIASQINFTTNAAAEFNKWGGQVLKYLNISEQEYQDLIDETHDRLDS